MQRLLRRTLHSSALAASAFAASFASCSRALEPVLATTPWRVGLIGPGADDRHYTSALDATEAARILKQPDHLWGAAEVDAREQSALSGRIVSTEEYLASVVSKAKAFMDSDTLHDRDDIRAQLDDIFGDGGHFGLVLGGKVCDVLTS